ncbi:unnamed protein product, partial [Musa banksii]
MLLIDYTESMSAEHDQELTEPSQHTLCFHHPKLFSAALRNALKHRSPIVHASGGVATARSGSFQFALHLLRCAIVAGGKHGQKPSCLFLRYHYLYSYDLLLAAVVIREANRALWPFRGCLLPFAGGMSSLQRLPLLRLSHLQVSRSHSTSWSTLGPPGLRNQAVPHMCVCVSVRERER